MYNPIADYAMLSNARLSALVARNGSIDWLCLPEPHSPAIFWSLLDDRQGGYWRIATEGAASVRRRYLPRTMTVESEETCTHGTVRRTDLIQLRPPGRREAMTPDLELTRRIECLGGAADVRIEFRPRPSFGRRRLRIASRSAGGFAVEAGAASLLVATDIPFRLDRGATGLELVLRVSAGDVYWMAMSHTDGGPPVWPMIGEAAASRTADTEAWWRSWAESCKLPSEHRDAVARSALTLKALSYPPTGAVLAAPTTSLPEQIGGTRNWDYRYCWVRDASLTMRALLNLGTHADAEAFLSWLLNATRLTSPRLRVLYDVYGRSCPRERLLTNLAGYESSGPVRTGNAARDQVQLDAYGALLDAAWMYHRREGALTRSSGRMLKRFVTVASRAWRNPDHGIWELRSGKRHHTLSKAMCWVAMERGLRLAGDGVFELDRRRIEREMAEVSECIRRDGFNQRLGSYTATLGGDQLDASLLLLGIYGFEDPASDRMNATIDRIYEHLSRDGAIRRYQGVDDGVPGEDQGWFGICGFWGVEALAIAGRIAEAQHNFEMLMSYANEVGLFAEEVGIDAGRAFGNFPQALTHVGVIDAASTLSRAGKGRRATAETGGAQ